MSKKRILHVVQCAGGVDRYLKVFLKYLDKNKFENILLCSDAFKKEDYLELVDSFEKVDMNREINLFKDLKSIIKIRKIIKEYKPDIVYAHSSKAGALARIANLKMKNICIYNPHGWAFNMNCILIKRELYSLIEKILASFCDRIVCISNAEKVSAIKRKICDEKKIKVILNGIDLGENGIREVKDTYDNIKIPENAFVVGMVGRITKQKAPDVFIKVANEILKYIPQAYFIIVGDGEMKQEIIDYAVDNNFRERLIITGWVNNPLNYVKYFDVALLLSRWEGFGLVLPEYMMSRKPIIASKIDAIPDIIIDHENGILVNVDDIEDTKKALLELYNDKNLCEKIVINGMKDVESKFNAKRMVEEHEILFNDLMRLY